MAKKSNKSFKDIFKGKLGGYIAITALFAVLLLFYPGNNLFTLLKTIAEIHSQERQMRKYQLEIVDMNQQIEDLTTDRDTLEKFARERFHFAQPGEDVYILK